MKLPFPSLRELGIQKGKSPPRTRGSLYVAGGLADHHFRGNLATHHRNVSLLIDRFDRIQNDSCAHGAHRFHWLTDSRERGYRQTCLGDIIKPDDRAILGDAEAVFLEGAESTERRHIVVSQESAERPFLAQQFVRLLIAGLETGIGIERFGELGDSPGIKAQTRGLSEAANTFPALQAAGEVSGPAKEGDIAMTQTVKMLERHARATLVVDRHGADGLGFKR